MKKETLTTKREKLSDQYAIATKAGQLIFISGKCAIKPDGTPIGLRDLDEEAQKLLSDGYHVPSDSLEGPIKAQTYWIYSYIRDVLKENGCMLDDILKANIYLVNINEFPLVNKVRKLFFPKNPPASTIVGVTGLCPVGARIEIEVIALKPE